MDFNKRELLEQKEELIDKIRNAKSVKEISSLLYKYYKCIDEDVIRVVYSRKDEFSGDDLKKLLTRITYEESSVPEDILKDCIQIVNDLWVSKIKNTKDAEEICVAFGFEHYDSRVVNEAFSRIKDFKNEDLEALYNVISCSRYATADMLKTIVKESNDFDRTIDWAINNENADETVVEALWNRKNEFKENELELLVELVVYCSKTSYKILGNILTEIENGKEYDLLEEILSHENCNKDLVDYVWNNKTKFIGENINFSTEKGDALVLAVAKSPYVDKKILKEIANDPTIFEIRLLNIASNKNADEEVLEIIFDKGKKFEGSRMEALYISLILNSNTPKKMLMTIASNSTDRIVILRTMYHPNTDKDVIEIIWNRRKEFGFKIYNGIFDCEYATKEMLVESFKYSEPTEKMLFAIFNENFDQDLYEIFISFNKNLGMPLKLNNDEINDIETTDFSKEKPLADYKGWNDFEKMCFSSTSIVKCVESSGDINQSAVENYIKYYLGEKCLSVYYKLRSFYNQRQDTNSKPTGKHS